MSLPKLIKMSDFAKAYGIGRVRAYDLIPKMPEGVVVRMGNRIRLHEERLKAWIESGGNK